MNSPPSPSTDTLLPGWVMALLLFKKLVIWGLFFAIIYLGREFFFLGFMTFIFSYMALHVVNWWMNRLWPGRDFPGRRKLLTVLVFLCLPVLMFGVGFLVMPHLVSQAQHFIGWVSQTNPEAEVAHLLEGMLAPSEFEQQFGNAQDPRYQKALLDFQKSGDRYVKQYLDFSRLQNWLEGGFNRQFSDVLRSKWRTQLVNEGVASKAFEKWFLTVKYPAKQQTRDVSTASGKQLDSDAQDWLRLTTNSTAQEALQQVCRSPRLAAYLQEEWINDVINQELSSASSSAQYAAQFQQYYEQTRKQKPDQVPYSLDEYLTLQQARTHGQHAFSEALSKLRPQVAGLQQDQVKADFETATKHQLFEQWWNTSSPAKFIRHELETHLSGNASGTMESMLASLLNVPLDICTAMLLSFLICIDFPAMRRAIQRLRNTWLREVYDEIVPALSSLAKLIGTSMYAQGLIALCNAVLVFIGLTYFGVEHALLLSMAVFLLCLIPTLGMIISWVLIVIVALIQPGGGFLLAIKVTSLVAVVVVLETFVFSPRILGKMMELHPVLIIAILPIAHSFFGIWGLLLAIPVAVFIINEVIFKAERAGTDQVQPGRHVEPATGI